MNEFHYEYGSDLVPGPLSEDGDETVEFRWYVVATELSTGRRWSHDHNPVTFRDEAPRDIIRLHAKVEVARPDPRNRPHWCETRPLYSSHSWGAWERDAERREREAEAWGG